MFGNFLLHSKDAAHTEQKLFSAGHAQSCLRFLLCVLKVLCQLVTCSIADKYNIHNIYKVYKVFILAREYGSDRKKICSSFTQPRVVQNLKKADMFKNVSTVFVHIVKVCKVQNKQTN